MDDLTYYYDAAKRHNRLRGVRDAVTGVQTGDLSSRMATETSADNYAYDASGNLISDTQGGLSAVSWNLSGKLRRVTRTDGWTVEYRYDAAGQRVAQTEGGNTTFYLRDASGNVMAIYEETLLTEHHLYGSSRLGTRRQGEAARTLTLGHKSYELSNHLSNVMAVISDHKLPEGNSWRAYVQSRTDYYAFGAAMPGRSGEGPYRYGLNGQEKGSLFPGHYTALYWEYDSRLGRRWNVDPKPNESLSGYATFGLNPILNADPAGDTVKVKSRYKDAPADGLYYKNGVLYTDPAMTNEYRGEGYNSKKGKYRGFLKQTVRALNEIENNSGEFGNKFINHIVGHEKTATIKEADRNRAIGDKVEFNPNSTSAVDGVIDYQVLEGMNRDVRFSTAWVSRKPFVGLAHELAHAQDWMDGTINNDTWYSMPNDKGGVSNIPLSEIHAIGVENKIREYHRMPLRDYYNPHIDANKGNRWTPELWKKSRSYNELFK